MKINLKELKSNIFQLILFALVCLIVVGSISLLISTGKSIKISDLGSFGDFFGGVLNPIFAFLAFLALLTTIVLQASELKATRKELKKSAKAQKEQSESLKLQNEATKLQIFENTLFKLFDVFNLAKNTVNIDISNYSITDSSKIANGKVNNNYDEEINYAINENKLFKHGTFTSNEALAIYSYIVKKNYINNYDNFNDKYERNTGVYFGQIYQTLKFIDDSNIGNKQRYVNIFRAQFTKDELEFLFYHCLGTIGKRKFKNLVENYEFFEHIILNENIEKQLLEYDKKAFGANEKILKRYDELKTK